MQRQRWGIAPAISFDEMWTYHRARHGKKRQEVWIWTAVIELPDGRQGVDFEVGDRSGETFLRLYDEVAGGGAAHSIMGKGNLANRSEGLPLGYRGRLKRLALATTGYTKQVWVLRGSRALWCLRPRRGQNLMPACVENIRRAGRAAFSIGRFDICPSIQLTPASPPFVAASLRPYARIPASAGATPNLPAGF